jgi:hypothetical protein
MTKLASYLETLNLEQLKTIREAILPSVDLERHPTSVDELYIGIIVAITFRDEEI